MGLGQGSVGRSGVIATLPHEAVGDFDWVVVWIPAMRGTKLFVKTPKVNVLISTKVSCGYVMFRADVVELARSGPGWG